MQSNKLLSYFLRGLLLFSPLIITIYILYMLFSYIDSLANDFADDIIGIRIWGLGILIIVIFITFLGFLSSRLFFIPIMKLVESVLFKTPLVKIIYSSIKDLFSAFVSEKKKFNKPVLVNINKEIGLQKLGFITQTDLSMLGLKDKVAVYLPHSYNFSGNLFIVNKEQVELLNNISSAEVMKFIISGGVTEFHVPQIRSYEEKVMV